MRQQDEPMRPSINNPTPGMADAIYSNGQLSLTFGQRLLWAFWLVLGSEPTYRLEIETENEVGRVDLQIEHDISWPGWMPRRRTSRDLASAGPG